VDADHQADTQYSDRLLTGMESTSAVQLPIGFTAAEAKAIADEMMESSKTRFDQFRNKYEPRARFKEYTAASPMLNQMNQSIANQMEAMARDKATIDPAFAEALESDKFNAISMLRNDAQKKLEELAAQGLEGQELYDAVDMSLMETYRKWSKILTYMSGEAALPFPGKPSKDNPWPFQKSAAQLNRNVSQGRGLSGVPEEFAGITQAQRFGNTFRSWVEELVTQDTEDLAAARRGAIKSATEFVAQVAKPKENNITISGSQIMRGDAPDQDATATYWNAKVQWAGLTVAEVKAARTEEGVQIPETYLLSSYTRIKGLDSQAALREALTKFEAGQGGILAEYMDALPNHYEAREVVDIRRSNLDRSGITE